MKKYALAAVYFGKALKLMQKSDQAGVQASNPVEATTSHTSVKVGEVCYNYGIALLKCKKYSEAFQCFNRASSLLRNMPRIWYHMALCCLHKQRENSTKAGASLSESDVCHRFKGFEQAGFEKNGGGPNSSFKRILLSAS
jgi:tetratricopeptide (TPR) repeat protein